MGRFRFRRRSSRATMNVLDGLCTHIFCNSEDEFGFEFVAVKLVFPN